MGLLGCYLLYFFISKMFQYFQVPNSGFLSLYRYLIACILSVVGIWIAYQWIDTEKLLSLTSRFVLMKESLMMMLQYPFSLLIGFGPDSLASHFSIIRSSLVSSYFPNHEIIDSSHNILIDIIFQYGILPIGIIGYTLWL